MRTEIDLPEIAKHPERAKFISTSEAVKIARRNGFDVAKAEMKLEYRSKPGVCVFLFEQITYEEESFMDYKCIDINAHDGSVLKTYTRYAFK